MKRRLLGSLAGLVVTAVSLLAVVPQKWELRSLGEFLKGKFDGVSVSSDGWLSLAPREDKIAGPAEEFYLSLLAGQEGSLYLGTGHSGKLYKIDRSGKSDLYAQFPEMDVTALAVDEQGTLYAGTSPNGKVYKISQKGKQETFFDPSEKYVWDLLFRSDGSLLIAVGENGGIYEVSRQGEGTQILKAEENHILCLRLAGNGDIIAGSGGDGLVYRLAKGGKVSVVFESPYEEVKSLALDREGNIYAAAGGTSTKAKKEEPSAPVKTDASVTITVSPGGVASEPAGIFAASAREPSALYRISPDGLAKRLWNSAEDLIYTLIWNEADKRVVFGTGNKGRIYAVDRDEKISLLFQEASEQVYEFLPSEQKTYILSNNPVRLGVLYPDQRSSGEYQSTALDSKTISSWGKIEWSADVQPGTSLQLLTRSGNSNDPNQTWSDWSPPYQKGEEQILSPKARYLQFKILLKTQTGKTSPVVQRVNLFYLQSNLAPLVNRMELLPANDVYLKLPEQDDVIWGLEKSVSEQVSKKDESRGSIPAKKVERKGFQTVIWDADDDNGDSLVYSLLIKKEGETQWRPLRDKWTDSIFAFDTQSYPDGVYFLKVVASDMPSNPPGLELQAERISSPLVIDNSLPVVKNFVATKAQNTLEVSFQAEDAFSYIEEVKILIRPDDWRVVFPVDGICDSKQENFKVSLKLGPNPDNLVTVTVKDSHGNVGVFRQQI